MIEPAFPKNEDKRMEFLNKLRILDTPIEERFERITRIVCRSLNVPISAISLIDDERQWFKSIQGLDVSETPRNIAFCAHAIIEDKPFVIEDASLDPRFTNNPLVTEDPSIRFYAGCPLEMGDGIRIGTLCAIDREPRSFSKEQMEILQDLTEMVKSEFQMIALSEAHESLITDFKQAERAALIDPLSRLWNRAGGENFLLREWEVAKRKKTPVSLAMLDIDHFKKINDTHGHGAGDQVIKHLSRIIISALRPYDVACRWGGEEFLIIMPDCSKTNLSLVFNRVIKAIHDSPINNLTVTASGGAVTAHPSEGHDYRTIIELADQALYKAKNNGRDQYMLLEA